MISGKLFASSQWSTDEVSSARKVVVMSQVDMKQSGSGQEHPELKAPEETPYRTMELAEELIRAMDAESNEHMQQISSEDKRGNS